MPLTAIYFWFCSKEYCFGWCKGMRSLHLMTIQHRKNVCLNVECMDFGSFCVTLAVCLCAGSHSSWHKGVWDLGPGLQLFYPQGGRAEPEKEVRRLIERDRAYGHLCTHYTCSSLIFLTTPSWFASQGGSSLHSCRRVEPIRPRRRIDICFRRQHWS